MRYGALLSPPLSPPTLAVPFSNEIFQDTEGVALVATSFLAPPPATPPNLMLLLVWVCEWLSSSGLEPVRLVIETRLLVTLLVDELVLLLDERGGGDGDILDNECNLTEEYNSIT